MSSMQEGFSHNRQELGTPVTPEEALWLLNSHEQGLSSTLEEERGVETVTGWAQAKCQALGRSFSDKTSLVSPPPDVLDADEEFASAKRFTQPRSLSRAQSASFPSGAHKSQRTTNKQTLNLHRLDPRDPRYPRSLRGAKGGDRGARAEGEKRAGGSAASRSKKQSYSSGAAFYASQVQSHRLESSQRSSSRTATSPGLSHREHTNDARRILRRRSSTSWSRSISDQASAPSMHRHLSEQGLHPSDVNITRASSG